MTTELEEHPKSFTSSRGYFAEDGREFDSAS